MSRGVLAVGAGRQGGAHAITVASAASRCGNVARWVSMLVFDNSYARLPPRFFARLDPTPVAKPRLIKLNQPLAAQLGFDSASLSAEALAAIFSGNMSLPGSEPIALAYAGHQF